MLEKDSEKAQSEDVTARARQSRNTLQICRLLRSKFMLANHPDPTVDHVLKTWAPRMIV